jgi:hypothetical protein
MDSFDSFVKRRCVPLDVFDEYRAAAKRAGIVVPSESPDLVKAVEQYLAAPPKGPTHLADGDYVLRVQRSEMKVRPAVWIGTFEVVEGTGTGTAVVIAAPVHTRATCIKSFCLAVMGTTEADFDALALEEKTRRLEAAVDGCGALVRCTVTPSSRGSRTLTTYRFRTYRVAEEETQPAARVSTSNFQVGTSGSLNIASTRDDLTVTLNEIRRVGVTVDADHVRRLQREAARREVDDVLHEYARRYPAFATARRAAVMAAIEVAEMAGVKGGYPMSLNDTLLLTRDTIRGATRYEVNRGIGVEPSPRARDCFRLYCGTLEDGEFAAVVAAYERARGLA